MNRAFLLLPALFFFSVSLPAAEQKFQPKTIQFEGAPEYSNQELMGAAGLKKGMGLTSTEMSAYSKRLLNSGVFEKLSFRFDGQDLVFSLQQSTSLYPVRLENLPLTPGKELDARLHNQVPLYHCKVPAEGTLLDDVRAALEEILAAQGIRTSLTVTPFTDLKLREVTAMSMSITTPRVQVGEIDFDNTSATPDPRIDPKFKEILTRLNGSPYGIESSPNQIANNLGNYYRDKGYLEAEVRAEAQASPVITPEAIRIPFRVSIARGVVYKLSAVQLAPGLLVSQADFDRQSHIHPGDIADGVHVRENWLYIERKYHDKGYMKAIVYPTPSLDRARGTAIFAVMVEPGPVYKMGALTIQNVSDDLRAAMLAAWPMPTGAVFNEGAILGFFATHGVNPALERVFATVDLKYVMNFNDDARTVDLVLRLERKH